MLQLIIGKHDAPRLIEDKNSLAHSLQSRLQQGRFFRQFLLIAANGCDVGKDGDNTAVFRAPAQFLYETAVGEVKFLRLLRCANSPLKKALLTGFHSTAKHNATKAVSPSSETMRTI